jgi:hypothetical protein
VIKFINVSVSGVFQHRTLALIKKCCLFQEKWVFGKANSYFIHKKRKNPLLFQKIPEANAFCS